MYIKTLSIKNFRNHTDTTISPAPGINILVGANAQGKTNLLEVLYLVCVGRGWRTNKDKELINFAADTSTIKATAGKSYGNVEIEIKLAKNAKKAISINQIPIHKMSELLGQINCVFFSPDELRLIKEAPTDRRRFMDIDISQIDKAYFYALVRYNKILAQRNALLKSSSEDIIRGLEIWDAELAKHGAVVMARRQRFIEQLKEYLEDAHQKLTNGKEKIEISYECKYLFINNINQDSSALEPILLESLKKSREKDMRLKTTTIGPHRDDIYLSINGQDVRAFASQGQQRTLALSLKLAELELFKIETGEAPIILLDDVFSELDINRQTNLLNSLNGYQSLITTNQIPQFEKMQNIAVFNIKKGKVL